MRSMASPCSVSFFGEFKVQRQQQSGGSTLPPIVTGLDIFCKEFPDEQWLVDRFLHRGLLLLCGPPKAGKTIMAHQIARSVITGEPFAGYECMATGKVLWVNL